MLERTWEEYGGKRAYLRHFLYRTLGSFGLLDSYLPVDVGPRRLVFVCKGNICRSPYAEARARDIGLRAISAGLEASDGQPADGHFSRVALTFGVDLSSHRSRNIADLELAPGDLLVAFEPTQAIELRGRYPTRGGPCVTLLGLFGRPQAPYIHDPHGASDEYARSCVQKIDRALAALALRVARDQRPSG